MYADKNSKLRKCCDHYKIVLIDFNELHKKRMVMHIKTEMGWMEGYRNRNIIYFCLKKKGWNFGFKSSEK